MKRLSAVLLISSSALLSSGLFTGCEHPTMAPAPAPLPMIAALHSPWQLHPVPVSAAPFECGPPVPMSPDLTVTTNQDSNTHPLSDDVKAAVYAESDRALHDLTARAVAAADAYQGTGSQAAAQCVVSLLADAAANHGMAGFMASADAWQEQNNALKAIAIAYLKVQPSGLANPAESSLINAWLRDITHAEIDHARSENCGARYCDLHGHRGLSVAMAAASVGIATNDFPLFRFALDQYRFAIRQIDARGMLPYDTSGGAYALRFNLVSAASLVQIAEFGELNGEPLYSYDNGQIHVLIHTVTRGLIDAAPYDSAAGATQKMRASIEPWEVSWASVYNRRFPDPLITSLLQQVGPAGADMWGGEPLQAP